MLFFEQQQQFTLAARERQVQAMPFLLNHQRRRIVQR